MPRAVALLAAGLIACAPSPPESPSLPAAPLPAERLASAVEEMSTSLEQSSSASEELGKTMESALLISNHDSRPGYETPPYISVKVGE